MRDFVLSGENNKMKRTRDKKLTERELQLYHEFFADSIIDPNFYGQKGRYVDQDESGVTSSTIEKEETKIRRSLRNRGEIPTEIWMG
jgi:hypothetical protein